MTVSGIYSSNLSNDVKCGKSPQIKEVKAENLFRRLPEELLSEIFSFVPYKLWCQSLVLVCKDWKILIENPLFCKGQITSIINELNKSLPLRIYYTNESIQKVKIALNTQKLKKRNQEDIPTPPHVIAFYPEESDILKIEWPVHLECTADFFFHKHWRPWNPYLSKGYILNKNTTVIPLIQAQSGSQNLDVKQLLLKTVWIKEKNTAKTPSHLGRWARQSSYHIYELAKVVFTQEDQHPKVKAIMNQVLFYINSRQIREEDKNKEIPPFFRCEVW